MKVTIKSPRANKRKLVVPFAGEENFVVPKQGGFGQPDNEEWISIESKYANLTAPIRTNSPSNEPTTQTGEGLPTGSGQTIENPNYNPSTGGIHGASTSGTGTSSSGTGGVDTTTITPELTPPVSSTPPTSGGTVSNETPSPNPPLTDTGVITTPPKTLGESTGGTSTGGTLTSGTTSPKTGESTTTTSTLTTLQQTQIPTFPDFSTLDCSALASQIASIQSQISQGNYTAQVGTAYNDALATAKSLYTTKCNIPSPPVVIAPVPTSAVGGGFGGGGGGGFGEQPSDTTTAVEETTQKSGVSWLWILAILGGIYFLTKSNKQ